MLFGRCLKLLVRAGLSDAVTAVLEAFGRVNGSHAERNGGERALHRRVNYELRPAVSSTATINRTQRIKPMTTAAAFQV